MYDIFGNGLNTVAYKIDIFNGVWTKKKDVSKTIELRWLMSEPCNFWRTNLYKTKDKVCSSILLSLILYFVVHFFDEDLLLFLVYCFMIKDKKYRIIKF